MECSQRNSKLIQRNRVQSSPNGILKWMVLSMDEWFYPCVTDSGEFIWVIVSLKALVNSLYSRRWQPVFIQITSWLLLTVFVFIQVLTVSWILNFLLWRYRYKGCKIIIKCIPVFCDLVCFVVLRMTDFVLLCHALKIFLFVKKVVDKCIFNQFNFFANCELQPDPRIWGRYKQTGALVKEACCWFLPTDIELQELILLFLISF